MKDPRILKLADILVNHATRVQRGEKLLIEDFGINTELVTALVAACYQAGGIPEVKLHDLQVDRALQIGDGSHDIHANAGG